MERVQLTQAQLNQRAFLGAALMDPAAAREYILRMLPIMFEAGVYQEIFAAVLSLTAAGQPVDVVTVVNAAQAATGQSLDNIKQIVTEMAETCPSISNIGSYAALVVEEFRNECDRLWPTLFVQKPVLHESGRLNPTILSRIKDTPLQFLSLQK